MFKEELLLGRDFERLDLVCFREQHDFFNDPGMEDLIEELLRISGDPSGRKHVRGRCRNTHGR